MMMDFLGLAKKYNMDITGVLHIGGNMAQEADLYDAVGAKEVIWIEAIPSVHERLKEKLKSYPGHYSINACIGDEDGREVEFNVSNNEGQSSSFLELGVHAQIHPTVHYVDKFKTKTMRVDTLLDRWNIYGFELNFLNIDIQGAELLALKGMGKYLNLFDYVWVEINKQHTYKDCPLVEEIDSFLSDFTRVETGAWVADCWTDGLYIRTSLLNNQK